MPVRRLGIVIVRGFDDKGAASELAYWKALAEQRRERGKFAEEMERNARGYDVKVTLGSSG
jgi:hypothetical protein